MEAANFTMWVGFGLIAVAVIAVFFSPYRRWLGFMRAIVTGKQIGRAHV